MIKSVGHKAFSRKPKTDEPAEPPKGFDDFELRLGDIMRGERATLGKSLLDVQRELKIKAALEEGSEGCDDGIGLFSEMLSSSLVVEEQAFII